jgi:hypothetical protein
MVHALTDIWLVGACGSPHRRAFHLDLCQLSDWIAVVELTQTLDPSCCFAVQDATWVKGPENDWEFSTVLADARAMSCGTGDACCADV